MEHNKTQAELIAELQAAKERIAELERTLRANVSNYRAITARKQTEEVLQSLARFPAENPHPVLRIEQDGTLLYANEASYTLLSDWPLDLGQPVPAPLREVVSDALAWQIGQTIEMEHGHRTFSFVVAPIVEVGYANLYGHDITERKQAEEALHERERKLSTILNLLPVGISILDQDRKVVYSNQALENILGTTKEGLVRGDYRHRKYLRADGSLKPVEEFASTRVVTEKTEQHNIVTGVVKEDGSIVWTSVNAAPVDFPGWKVVLVTTDITERKQAEEALRASEERYRSLFENMLNGFAYCQMFFDQGQPQDFVYLAVNRAFETLTGLKDVVGKKVSQVIPGIREANPELFRIYGRVALTGMPEAFETYLESLQMWFLVSVYSPQPEYFVAVFDVITERKQAEQALRLSELGLKEAQATAHIGNWAWNVDKGEVTWSDEMYRIFGIDKNSYTERLGDAIAKVIHPDDLHLVLPSNAKSFAEKKPVEYRIILPDKSIRTIWAKSGEAMVDSNGKPTFLTGIAQDITERKRTEAALRESEAKFRSLFHNVSMSGVIYRLIRDERNEIVDWELHDINELGAADINQNPSDLIGKRASDLFGAEVMKPYLELCRTVVASNQPQNIETHFVHNNKDYLTALFAIGTEFYANISIDITQRKRMEEELRRSNAELEQFAYVASHDLQEPLRAVAGMMQLLGQRYKGKLDDRADEYINHAVEASARMQNLINDLLDYSRVGRLGKPLSPTAAEKSLNIALANLQAAIQENRAQITHDPLPTVAVDPGQLAQVLQNLIGNALKFRGENSPHIHISAAKVEHAWRFAVSDNGLGIDPQYFERIFLVFQRLHTRREYPGTGIGLSLCKKIIERHGGQIWVESQPGQGSTFYFTIPERTP